MDIVPALHVGRLGFDPWRVETLGGVSLTASLDQGVKIVPANVGMTPCVPVFELYEVARLCDGLYQVWAKSLLVSWK